MDGGGNVGGWFQEYVSKKVGDGTDTLFWFDKWLGSVPLCVRFRMVFELFENKSITVAHLFSPQLWKTLTSDMLKTLFLLKLQAGTLLSLMSIFYP